MDLREHVFYSAISDLSFLFPSSQYPCAAATLQICPLRNTYRKISKFPHFLRAWLRLYGHTCSSSLGSCGDLQLHICETELSAGRCTRLKPTQSPGGEGGEGGGARKTSSWTIFCAPKATGCGERTSNAKDSERCHYLSALKTSTVTRLKGEFLGHGLVFQCLICLSTVTQSAPRTYL